MKRVIAVASVLVLFVGVAVEMASAQGAGAKPAPGATPAPAAPAQTAAPRRSPGAGPIIVFETMKGSFEIETYPKSETRHSSLLGRLMGSNESTAKLTVIGPANQIETLHKDETLIQTLVSRK